MASVSRIARSIAAAEMGNVLDDYYRFYNDGKWVVDVARRASSTLAAMKESMFVHLANVPKLEECVGYLSDSKVDGLGVKSCSKELRERVSEMKRRYAEWEKAGEEEQTALYDDYMTEVMRAKEYVDAFLQSCVNAFRNRYVEDEENVRNLLGVIHSTGNSVLNNGAGEKN